MKVKVSNPMLKVFKAALSNCSVTLEKMLPEQYEISVDYDLFKHEVDYSTRTGKFSVLRIAYPPEYYAIPKYITTRDLHQIYQASDKTYTGYIEAIKDYCAI